MFQIDTQVKDLLLKVLLTLECARVLNKDNAYITVAINDLETILREAMYVEEVKV